MGDGTYRGRWVDEVFRTALITDATRVALLALALAMDESGRVSVPRDELAARLGRNRRKVDDRIKLAREAGFLVQVERGQKHRTTVYRAALPDRSLSTPPGGHAEDSQYAGFKHAEPDSQYAGFKHAEDPQYAPRGARRDDLSTPPGGRATYKGTADVSRNADDAVVIDLFDEKAAPSLRSKEQKPARKRASESSAESPAFDEFWRAYPRRIAKAAARKAWDKALKANADPDAIIAAAKRFATDPRRVESDIKYTPHPATWLNAERWTDETEPTALARVPTVAQHGGIDQRMTEHAALIAQLAAQENNR